MPGSNEKTAGGRLRELFRVKWEKVNQEKIADYFSKFEGNESVNQGTISRWLKVSNPTFSPTVYTRLEKPLRNAGLNPDYLNDKTQPKLLEEVELSKQELEKSSMSAMQKLVEALERERELMSKLMEKDKIIQGLQEELESLKGT